MGDRARTVADATGGLLGDAWLLALAGCEVTAFERCAAVARIARDGLERAARDPRVDKAALGRLRLVEADAIHPVDDERDLLSCRRLVQGEADAHAVAHHVAHPRVHVHRDRRPATPHGVR
jgi:hypothetical protein